MQLYNYPGKEKWAEIIQRPEINLLAKEKNVRKIMDRVKQKGDEAIRKFTKEFDGVKVKTLRVSENEVSEATSQLESSLKQAIQQAKQNIEAFHNAQKEEIKKIETTPGVICWRRAVAIEKVGLYIPGGSAPLFSTVLMLGVPASLAGCKEIALCSPPSTDGTIHPAILYAARLCGITNIFKAGGVHAIAAMAYGTETIPKVSKIFGPGNQYVTLAKQLIQQEGTAIDMLAGPSELMVIADDTAVAEFVAADLLSQAEHGPDSQVLLITISEKMAADVLSAIRQQLDDLPRKEFAQASLQNSKVIVVETMDLAVELSNRYAPEHLILSCNNVIAIAEKITNAGSVFLGNYSPESAGDYASGTNHVLPTNGYASAFSGVSLDSFVKKISYQQLSKEGLKNIGNAIMEMAKAEGLEAHRKAVGIRLK